MRPPPPPASNPGHRRGWHNVGCASDPDSVIAKTTRRERGVRKGRPVTTRIGACGAALGLALALAACTGSVSSGPHQQVPSPGRRASTAPPLRPVGARPPPGGGLSPAQIRAAYDLGPLLRDGIDGRGQTIVIVDPFGSPTIAHDLAVFDQWFGLPPPPSLRVIQPAGTVPPYRRNGNRAGAAGETTLDVEWAHVIAPGAKILLVETPTAEIEGRTGFPQIVTAEEYVIRHHLGGVISQSFGATEATFRSPAAIRQLRGAYQLAARPAYRVTVLASTGDNGAAGADVQPGQLLHDAPGGVAGQRPAGDRGRRHPARPGQQRHPARAGRGLVRRRWWPLGGVRAPGLPGRRRGRRRAPARHPRHLHGRRLRERRGGVRQLFRGSRPGPRPAAPASRRRCSPGSWRSPIRRPGTPWA